MQYVQSYNITGGSGTFTGFDRVRVLSVQLITVVILLTAGDAFAQLPDVPALDAPSNNSLNVPTTLTLLWHPAVNASSHNVQLSFDSLFTVSLVDDSILADTSRLVAGLLNNTSYFWRVRGLNATGAGAWSGGWTFITVPLPPASPAQLSPSNGAIDQPLTSLLRWSSSAGAARYIVQVSPDSLFASFLISDSTVVDTFRSISGLSVATNYFWRVFAANAGGSSPPGGISRFTTVLPLAITTTSPLPPGTAGISYSTGLGATGGAGPYSWNLAGGSLPPGYSLSSGGVISGIDTIAGSSSFTVRVTDALLATSTAALTLNVSPGSVARMLLTQQPTNTVAGATISPAVGIRLADAFGNTVPTAGDTVRVSLNTGSGILSGTSTRITDIGGTALFNDLSINLSGAKTLRIAHAGLPALTSNAFTISPGGASRLLFVQQPTSTTSATVIAPPVTIQILDQFGNGVPASGVPVTIGLLAGTGSVAGTVSRPTDLTGLATFNDLFINASGLKQLGASSGSLVSDTSQLFTIATGSVSNFLVEGISGGPILTQTANVQFSIRITARDAGGNIVPTFNQPLNVTSTGTLTSGSVTTSPFVNGILADHRVTISNTGVFTITVSQSEATVTGTSNTFTVGNPAPSLTSIIPATRTVGDAGFTMSVTGSNFVPGSVVNVAGSPRSTTFIGTTSLTATIPASDIDTTGTFSITVTNPSPGGGVSASRALTVLPVTVNAKIYLQGAFRSGSMTTTLRTLLPVRQPYSVTPWAYAGAESASVLPASVVDWVLLELRTTSTAVSRIARRSAFLRSDGQLIDTDGSPQVTFGGVPIGSYYLVVIHRNHLSAMSASPIPLSAASTLYDFTTGTSKYFGNDAKNLGPGVFGLYAGDYSGDDFIDSDDFIGPDNELFKSGYRRSDLNMDGFVDSDDFIHPDNNVFKGSHVPK